MRSQTSARSNHHFLTPWFMARPLPPIGRRRPSSEQGRPPTGSRSKMVDLSMGSVQSNQCLSICSGVFVSCFFHLPCFAIRSFTSFLDGHIQDQRETQASCLVSTSRALQRLQSPGAQRPKRHHRELQSVLGAPRVVMFIEGE